MWHFVSPFGTANCVIIYAYWGTLRLLTGVQKTKRLRKKAIVIVIVIVKLIVIVIVVVVVKGGTPYNPPYRFSTVYKKSSAYPRSADSVPLLRTAKKRNICLYKALRD